MNSRDPIDPGGSSSASFDVTVGSTVAGPADAAVTDRSNDASTTPARGQQIGRYVVLEPLGAGAMGVVVAAYDPELDRKVALKLLHPRARSGGAVLLAEAQALARLSDPHVVAVHDVGTHGGQVFVAMEFVHGDTLGRWIAQRRPGWAELLGVMLRAGRGLAAAHARELIHRDFKPDNVMIDQDGRVRVMDFGLALIDERPSSDAEQSRSAARAIDGDAPSTRRGAMVGTPAYMAPEQIRDGSGGAAADQFSFCATFWEGLYDQRPFLGDSLPEMFARVLDGSIAEPPRGTSTPRWLRRVLERGLAVDPQRRWPSMAALLHALERGRARARRKRVLVLASLVLVAGAGAGGVHLLQQRRIGQACADEGASITQVWNDDVAARMRATMVATGLRRGADTMDRLAPRLDARAEALQRTQTDACIATRVERRWDDATVDQVQWCLDDRRMEFETLVVELGKGEPADIDMAVRSAARLGPVAPCLDVDARAVRPTPSGPAREQIRSLRAELFRARALEHLGKYDQGLALTAAMLPRTESVGWPPLVASARLQHSNFLYATGDYALALRLAEDAYFEAAGAEAYDTAAAAAGATTAICGELARYDEALGWSRHQALVAERVPDPDGLREGNRRETLATLYYAMGDYDDAIASSEQALEIKLRALGPDDPQIADSLTNLGNFRQTKGEYAAARSLHERALRLREITLGDEHPLVAQALSNLASIEIVLGARERAASNLARALAILEAALGSEHPDLTMPLNNLASVELLLGHYAAAQALYERALRIAERTLGPSHPRVAGLLSNLAETVRNQGDLALARAYFTRALEMTEATRGDAHANLAYALQGLANVALTEGNLDEARTFAQRAVTLREGGGVGSDLVAEARFIWAQALWGEPATRPEGIAMAQRAATEMREHGEARADALTEIEAWLREHPP